MRQFGAEMRDLETAVPSPQLRTRIMASLPEMPPVSATPSVRWKPNPAPRYALAGAFSLFVVVGAFAFNRFNTIAVPQNGVGIETGVRVSPPLKDNTNSQPIVAETNTTPVVLPPDDLSAKADQMIAAQEKAREQKERHAWRLWVRQTPELRQTAAMHTQPTRVTLSVSHTQTDAAVETLRQKVTALGGKLYSVSNPNREQALPGVFSNASAESLYAAKVPTAQVGSFVEALHAAGTMQTSGLGVMPKLYRESGIASTAFIKADGITLKPDGTNPNSPSASKSKLPAAKHGESLFILIALRQGD